MKPPGNHCHPPDLDGYGLPARAVLEKAKDAVRAKPLANPMEVLLEARRQVPVEVGKQLRPSSKVRTLRHHAASVRPPVPKDLKEIHDYIQHNTHEDYTVSNDGTRMESIHCTDCDSLILYTRRVLDTLPRAVMVQADATYKVVEEGISVQLFTIHGNWNGYASLLKFRKIIRCLLQSMFTCLTCFLCPTGRNGGLRSDDSPDKPSIQGGLPSSEATTTPVDHGFLHGRLRFCDALRGGRGVPRGSYLRLFLSLRPVLGKKSR